MDINEFNDAVEAVETAYDADVYLYNAPIDEEGFAALAEAVARKDIPNPRKNCVLILTTYGGLANSGYQIARLIQNTYDKFYLYCPSMCKSAGTIVALGAHEIIMDVFSELGPLDVQLLEKDEIGRRKSGLLTRSAFEALSEEAFDLFQHTMLRIKAHSGDLVSFRLATEIATNLTSSLMAPVYAQLSPEVIGSDFRDLSVATEYGMRLSKISRNPKSGTIYRLVREYPSHDFIIDSEEAASLFENVSQPKDELYKLIGCIADITHRVSKSGVVTSITTIEQTVETEQKGEDDEQVEDNVGEQQGLDESGTADIEGDQKPKRSAGRRKTGAGDKIPPK